MMRASDAVMLEASDSQAKLQDVKKLSEGLGEELGAIMAASKAWNSLGDGGSSQGGSMVHTDAELRMAFDRIDTDSNGSIEAEELAAAIRGVDGTLSNTTVTEMMSYADTDGDGRCAKHECRRVGCVGMVCLSMLWY